MGKFFYYEYIITFCDVTYSLKIKNKIYLDTRHVSANASGKFRKYGMNQQLLKIIVIGKTIAPNLILVLYANFCKNILNSLYY